MKSINITTMSAEWRGTIRRHSQASASGTDEPEDGDYSRHSAHTALLPMNIRMWISQHLQDSVSAQIWTNAHHFNEGKVVLYCLETSLLIWHSHPNHFLTGLYCIFDIFKQSVFFNILYHGTFSVFLNKKDVQSSSG